MADELKNVIEDLGRTFEQFKQKNDQRLAEIESKGAADPLLEQQVNKMSSALGDLESLKSRLEATETALARGARAGGGAGGDQDMQKAADFARMCARKRGVPVEDFTAADLTKYKSAFGEFMRKGDLMSLDAQKALSVGTDPDGGYTVDPDTSGRIVTKIFESSPMRQFANVQTIGTDALEGMFDLDEAGAGWVTETSEREETKTPKLGAWRIPVHEIFAFPFATQKVLDDSELDLEAWLSDKVADKMGRKENAAFVRGDGNGKPRGFLTYSNGTTLPKTIERKLTGVNAGFATDGSGADVLIDTIHALKQGYRANARWFMGRTTTATVRKIKDSDGRYLWQPALAAGQPATLAGYGVSEFEDMPEIAQGSLSIAFGNMNEAYQIVDRQGVRVLRDPYTKKPFVGFYTVKRTGGDVVNFEALKLIEFSQ